MKLSEITLKEVKDRLNIDDDDIVHDEKLKSLIKNAISYILKTNGQDSLTPEFEDSNEYLSDIFFCYILNHFDKGVHPESKYFYAALTLDRRFD